MRRVLFVLPSFAGGGAERVIIGLANGLSRRTFTPLVLVLENTGPLAADLDDDIQIISLNQPRLRRAILPIRRAIAEVDPSVVVSTMGYLNLGVLWAVGNRRKNVAILVREANDPDVTISALPVAAIGRWLYRRYYRRASVIVVPSKAIGARLATLVPDASEMIRLLHNPVDDVKVRQAAAAPVREPGNGVRFVASGRLTHQKGFDRLLDWISDMRQDAVLTILGEGPERKNLERRIASLGLEDRVNLAGFVHNPWAYYAGADAFLLASRWEGMPNAALEALACGTPVIAMSEAGAVREIADEAPKQAISIVDTGEEFVTNMLNVGAGDGKTLRGSLLPSSFLPASVGQEFEALISATDSC